MATRGRAEGAVLLATVLLVATLSAASAQPGEDGRDLYVSKCASCHGARGIGTANGPSLADAGAASADFYLRTGRMPLPYPEAPTQRKPVTLSDDEIGALVEYVASLGDGPAIPAVATAGADLSEGARLFAANCAACHGATANGGAVGGNAFAPSLYTSAPLDIAEATIVGPGEMPVFNLDESERNALVAYVLYLQDQEDPGGLDIGGIGPVPEGFVAWALAMTVLVVIVLLIGRRKEGSDGP
jgi:ubiquinol-cytochrome c reductase cytochrome c subunit